MPFKIFKEDKATKDVFLGLVKTPADEKGQYAIDLVALDENGKPLATILSLEPDGTFNRWSLVAKDLGFTLDHVGKVVIAN